MRVESTRGRRALVFVAAASIALPLSICSAQEAPAWHGYATLASSYTFRGVVLSDSPTWKVGAERQGTAWTVGAWGVGVERAWPYGEVENGWLAGAYLARDGGCGTRCRWRATFSRYVHPGSEPGGWTELSFAARWRERFGIQGAIARHDQPDGGSSRTLEAFVAQPLSDTIEAALTLGASDYDRYGYRHVELDVTRAWRRYSVSIGARYGEVRPPQARAESDTRLVAELGVSF